MTAEDRLRLTSRILLLDADDRILLFKTIAPASSGFARWITPGGGVDPGESHADAAVRELFEETGLVVETVGEPVWSHDFVVQFDRADHNRGHAEFYALRTENFAPSSANWTPEEQVDVLESRWWSAEELAETAEPFEPAELPHLLGEQLSRGV